jgi:magnesium transporter
VSTDIRTRLWRGGILEQENFPFEDISEYLGRDDCVVWADLCSPAPEHLDQLAEELGLDKHAVEDAVSEHERPKLTKYSTHVFLTTSALSRDPETGLVVSSRVSAFKLKNVFVTVRLDASFDFEPVVRRWDEDSDLVHWGPRALIHGLLDEIVDGYFEVIGSLDDAIDEAEDMLFDENSGRTQQLQRHTYALRKALVVTRRVVLPMREVVAGLMRRLEENGDERAASAGLAPYLEDLYDHVLRASEWTESLRDMISSIFETNMSLSDNRMNLVMKKLTAWAAIIAVPTAITGYFGQNVPYPGFGKEWGWVFSSGAILLIAFALWGTFRRKDWL